VLTLDGLLWGMPPHFRHDWLERFWARVEIGTGEDGCWYWRGATTAARYGIVSVNRQLVRAHRLSYLIHNGSLSADRYCLHRCDEPSCVNPRHLFVGTARDNARDMVAKGRGAHRKLNPDVVRAMRFDHASGVSLRELAMRHNVSPSTVFAVTARRTWRNVQDYAQRAA
jgi:hypothetical protein